MATLWAFILGRSSRPERRRGFIGNWPTDPVGTGGSQARIVDDTAGPPSASDRFFGFWNIDSQEDMVMWTNSFAGFTLSAQSSASIDWFQRNTNGSGGASEPGTRAAVGVNTGSEIRWFASNPLEVNSTAAWTQESADLLAPIWIEFDFDGTLSTDDPGGFDAVGAAGALPLGNIVAAGLYLEYDAVGTSGDSIRIDSFRLNAVAAPLAAVPEPASIAVWSLLWLVAIGLASVRRRK